MKIQKSVLRDHYGKNSHHDDCFKLKHASVCSHSAFGLIRSGAQTTNSMLVEFTLGATPLIFATATAAPCQSLFKPFFVDVSEAFLRSLLGPAPRNSFAFDDSVFWWAHESRCHRPALLKQHIALDFEALECEKNLVDAARKVQRESQAERTAFVGLAFSQASIFMYRHARDIANAPFVPVPLWYLFFWYRQNRACGLKLESHGQPNPLHLVVLISVVCLLLVSICWMMFLK